MESCTYEVERGMYIVKSCKPHEKLLFFSLSLCLSFSLSLFLSFSLSLCVYLFIFWLSSVIALVISLQHTATHCNTLQHTATHCNTLQHTAIHIFKSIDYPTSLPLQIHCNTLLQRTATHYNTMQHTAWSHVNRTKGSLESSGCRTCLLETSRYRPRLTHCGTHPK